MILKSYAEWRDCIERKCGIPLTQSFAEKRLDELADNTNPHSIEFIALYGIEYKNQIVSWFIHYLATFKSTAQ